MTAYYNEIDPYAAQWLRNLIAAGHIAPGDVDERSIEDVFPDELAGYTQCHFFAGIGLWSLALRKSGWPDDRPVWTGSCPCQSFSSAGKGKGFDDERHLWPAWFELIRECRPRVIFGEQVASADVIGRSNKETRPRVPTLVSAQTPGQGFSPSRQGAIFEKEDRVQFRQPFAGNSGTDRQRILRVNGSAFEFGWGEDVGQPITGQDDSIEGVCLPEYQGGLPRDEQRYGGLGRAENGRISDNDPVKAAAEIKRIIREIGGWDQEENGCSWIDVISIDLEEAHYSLGAVNTPACGVGAPHIRQRLWFVAERLADADEHGSYRAAGHEAFEGENGAGDGVLVGGGEGLRDPGSGPTNGVWSAADWLFCRDGKCRPVEPGTFPLADGYPNRVGKLRAYGNAINVEVAKTFIEAAMTNG